MNYHAANKQNEMLQEQLRKGSFFIRWKFYNFFLILQGINSQKLLLSLFA